MESDITDLLSNSSIPSIFPAGQPVKVSGNGWILPPGISLVVVIVHWGLARELPGDHIVEYSKAIPSAGVSMVVLEFTYALVLWTHIGVCMGTDCVCLQIIPVAVSVRASTVVLQEVIVWVCDPEACWSLIRVQKGPRSLGLHYQILVDIVLFLNCIFNENRVTLYIEAHILSQPQIMSSVKSESSVETLVGSKSSAVGLVNSANHVEMDCVPSNFESLADIS